MTVLLSFRTRDAGDPDPAGYFRYGAHFLDSESLAHRAVDILSDRKALDIALLDISRTATFTDYFVIATAQSPLQFSALAEYLEKEFKPEGHDLRHREGSPASGWMLLDFGDIIVHIFSPDQRSYYRLEELWGRTSPVVHFAN
jgi:ribosome-associated protein